MKNLIYAALAILLFNCSRGAEEEAPAGADRGNDNLALLSPEQIKNAGIVTGSAERRAVSSVLRLNGRVDVPPQNTVSVSVPLGGYVRSMRLLPGTRVKKGEVLAVMEDQQYVQLQQDYLTGKARLAFLESDYLRQKALNLSKSSSDKTWQQAQADYRSQQVLVRSLEEKLQLIGINPDKVSEDRITGSIRLLSPVNGFVSSVNTNVGKYVSPTEVLFELIDPADIHLALKVFEKDLEKVKTGQRLTAYTNDEPDKKYNCRVILVSKNLSPERTAEVHCHFENYDARLVPGMFMNAMIDLQTREVLTVPEDAVVTFEEKQYIFLPKGKGAFEMTEIRSGATENGYTEIASEQGLAGAEIVTQGAYSLLMSLKNKSDD